MFREGEIEPQTEEDDDVGVNIDETGEQEVYMCNGTPTAGLVVPKLASAILDSVGIVSGIIMFERC